MFHPGDLQSGISRAIEEQKLVACLIRQDDDELSTVWEHEWLQSPVEGYGKTLGEVLATKAVLLRIDHGSQEAAFLSAVASDLEKVPAFVVIVNGRSTETLEGGISKDTFVHSVMKAVGLPAVRSAQTEDDAAEEELYGDGDAPVANVEPVQESPMTATIQPEQQTVTGTHVAASSPVTTVQPTPGQPLPSSAQVQDLFSERATRLEADKKAKEANERAERIARANARRKEAQEAEEMHKPDKGKQREGEPSSENIRARQDWVRQQKVRNDEAKKERERILAQIESDRLDRRARETQRRELAKLESEQSVRPGTGTEYTIAHPPDSRIGPPGSGNQTCALQIRLFDGTSIKSRFAPDATLNAGVRTWIEQVSPPNAADIPYSFRQILAPQPSRSIEISEEHHSLRDLGLMPTATLVLVPVAGYQEAYAASGAQGMLSRGLAAGYGLVYGVLGYAGSVIGAATGYGRNDQGSYMGGTADEQEPSNTQGQTTAGSAFGSGGSAAPGNSTPPLRVRTLFDQRTEAEERGGKEDKKSEFYNGNSLGFQPRDEDET